LDNSRKEKKAMSASSPDITPDITLDIRGLFLFAFEKEKGFCQLGIMEAEKHCLKIKINTLATSLPDSPECLYEIPNGDIIIEVSGRARGVETYEPGLFKRDESHDPRDFRWILDFESPELHNRQIQLNAGALQRSLFIYNGLFYTRGTLAVLIQGPSSPQQKALIADSVGCDIYLRDQEEFLIRYGPQAENSIPIRKEPGISYKISVENLCSREENPISPGTSDFSFYYEVINVLEQERFTVFSVADPRDLLEDTNPCSPASVSITTAPLI
jgi:hypothetical protein